MYPGRHAQTSPDKVAAISSRTELARLVAPHLLAFAFLVATVVVGANTGYSAIVVAHELIHRRSGWEQQLGRLLMCTAMYEHFRRGSHERRCR
jgi:hypothetical protein